MHLSFIMEIHSYLLCKCNIKIQTIDDLYVQTNKLYFVQIIIIYCKHVNYEVRLIYV